MKDIKDQKSTHEKKKKINNLKNKINASSKESRKNFETKKKKK